MHPNKLYSILVGEKLLGHAHSAYYQPRGHPLAGSTVHRAIPRHYRDFLVVRRVEEGERESGGELFFLEVVNGTWHKWSGLHPADLTLLHLSVADILPLSAVLLDTILLAGDILEHFLQLSPPLQEPRNQGWMTREGRPLVVAQDTQHVLLVDSIESFKQFNVKDQVRYRLFAIIYSYSSLFVCSMNRLSRGICPSGCLFY
jgi:hypothetical protein